MAQRDRYTYEIVRKKGVLEGEFLAGLDKLGFEIVRNYEALPRNYRVHHKDQAMSMDLDACLALLRGWDLCEDDPMWGEEKVVQGERTTETRFFGEIDVRVRDGDEPSLSSAFIPKASDRYGAHWGVAVQVSDDFSAGFAWDSVKEALEGTPHEITHELIANGVDYFILDTGVDRDHPEFDELEYGTRAFWVSGGDGFYETNDDDQNHGTGMASCGAGKSMGVAINARVFAAKGLDGNNSGSSSALIDGMNALVAAFSADTSGRPGVMNNSWTTSSSTAYTAAVDAAVDAGMVMVGSGGNDYSSTLGYPANYDDVLGIGAMDITRRKADFSNYGINVDLWSAGVDILQGWRGATMGWGNGTSPAGGFTTGLVCCLLQGYKRPSGRTDVESVYQHVINLAQDGLLSTNVQGDLTSTTKKVARLPTGGNPSQSRIPGLLNLVAQKRHKIGGSCFSRGQVRVGGVSAPRTAPVHPRRSTLKERLHIGLPSPVSAGAWTTIKPWLCQNFGIANVADAYADVNVLARSTDHNATTDGDGDALTIPGRDADQYSFIGGTADFGAMYQTIPLRMTEDSNPVSFFDIFTNLDWETGTLTGWTTSGAGTPAVKKANGTFYSYTGGYFYEGTGGASSAITQVATLPASVSTAKIDAGKMRVSIQGIMGSSFVSDPNDQGRVRLVAVDGVDADISTIFDTGITTASTVATGWDTPFHGDVAIPANTRKLKLIVDSIFGAGTIINRPVDSLMGWVYEKTSAGDRIADAIKRGKAELLHECVVRSFNIDTDDQGRVEMLFINSAGAYIGSSEHDGYVSPHNWTQQFLRRYIPEKAVMVRLRVLTDLRAGSVINWYNRDHKLEVRIGQRARRAAGKSRAQVRGTGLLASTTGYDASAGSIYRP